MANELTSAADAYIAADSAATNGSPTGKSGLSYWMLLMITPFVTQRYDKYPDFPNPFHFRGPPLSWHGGQSSEKPRLVLAEYAGYTVGQFVLPIFCSRGRKPV